MSDIVWPDPTEEMLEDPAFNAIWRVIRTWDINVPGVYEGYCGATGNHARAILDEIKRLRECVIDQKAMRVVIRRLEEERDNLRLTERLAEKTIQELRDELKCAREIAATEIERLNRKAG